MQLIYLKLLKKQISKLISLNIEFIIFKRKYHFKDYVADFIFILQKKLLKMINSQNKKNLLFNKIENKLNGQFI